MPHYDVNKGVTKTRNRGRGWGLSFFFKECCFRVRARVTRMITDRIGLYSVLLPLLIRKKGNITGIKY